MKKLFTITLLLIGMMGAAQSNIAMNVSQDAKLLFVGDDKGNEPGTIDLTIRSEWQGNQFNSGYMFVAPEFEIAELAGGTYRRYSGNVGYSFNKWIDKFTFTASAGYGILDYNGGMFSMGLNFQTSYAITSQIEVFLDCELTERGDLHIFFRQSGKFGVKFIIFNK